jgi:hypothetical protein
MILELWVADFSLMWSVDMCLCSFYALADYRCTFCVTGHTRHFSIHVTIFKRVILAVGLPHVFPRIHLHLRLPSLGQIPHVGAR